MYFKTLVKRAAKEIIQQEKKVCEEKGWELSFCSETVYGYDKIALEVKSAKNYQKVFEIDLPDYEEKYGKESKEYFDLWFITEHILEAIDNLGCEVI